MRADVAASGCVDHGPDVGRGRPRVAQFEFACRAFEHGQHRCCYLALQEQRAQRRTTLPCAVKCRGKNIAYDLFRQRGGIDDHGIDAAGFGDQHGIRIEMRGQRGVDTAGTRQRTGETHAGNARIAGQGATHMLAIAWQQDQHVARHARQVQQRYRAGGHQRGLLGGLGDYRITRDQRRRHLAGEDRKRKIPRRNAHEWPQGRTFRGAQGRACLGRVVAQQVDRLAQFGKCVAPGLAGFTRGQCEQFAGVLFVELGCAFQQRGALDHRAGLPTRKGRRSRAHGIVDLLRTARLYVADPIAGIRRAHDRECRAGATGDGRHSLPAGMAEWRHGEIERRQCVRVG